jgi:hypothetical protein
MTFFSLAAVRVSLIVAIVVGAAGCGSGTIKAKGRVTKSGGPFKAEPSDMLLVTFLSQEPPKKGSGQDAFPANVNREDGSFQVQGPFGKGIPPGKYRISVKQIRRNKDVLKGAFEGEKSPFVKDVTSTDEIILDLDKPS